MWGRQSTKNESGRERLESTMTTKRAERRESRENRESIKKKEDRERLERATTTKRAERKERKENPKAVRCVAASSESPSAAFSPLSRDTISLSLVCG
jgi:hypothetical protein